MMEEHATESMPLSEWGAAHLPHYDLTPSVIPSSQAGWGVIVHFAHTFDGYQVAAGHHELPRLVESGVAAYTSDGRLPQGLTQLRTALFGMQRWDHMGGANGFDGEELRFVRGLVEGVRAAVLAGAHRRPDPSTVGGIQDKAFNAYDRLVDAYAHWGGYRWHGWTDYPDPSNYQGPTVWSERDCGLRLALELEREWPESVHMEFAIGKASRSDFAAPEKAQRVDVAVSDLTAFVEDEMSQERFRTRRHEAFFEVKWLLKGWRGQRFEMDAITRIASVQTDVAKLAHHRSLGRCAVAAMFIVDDEDFFSTGGGRLSAALTTSDSDPPWPHGVWRLCVGPEALRRRGKHP